MGFPGGSVVKNPPGNAGHTGDADSNPGSGRSPGGANGSLLPCFSVLARETPWKEESGRLQSMESQRHGKAIERARTYICVTESLLYT